ncbi:MAG: chorismate mutase [Alphaproteobacteria bacterium]|nr:chorismate mutase [Alphaproteobacteria bacterium]
MADLSELERLRAEIDAVDTAMHDLLIRRAEVVKRLGPYKESGSAMRPAREIQVIQRRLHHHRGDLPAAVVVRLWREIVAACLRLQGLLAVAVCASGQAIALWDLAREHFGTATPMALYPSAGLVLNAVAEGSGVLGVLPQPQEGESDPWWPLLVRSGAAPRVLVRLPAYEDGTRREPTAFVVGRTQFDRSGADVSLVAVAGPAQISRSRLGEIFLRVGTRARCVTVREPARNGHAFLHLVEIDGYVPAGDARLAQIEAGFASEIERIAALGGYALPLGPNGEQRRGA